MLGNSGKHEPDGDGGDPADAQFYVAFLEEWLSRKEEQLRVLSGRISEVDAVMGAKVSEVEACVAAEGQALDARMQELQHWGERVGHQLDSLWQAIDGHRRERADEESSRTKEMNARITALQNEVEVWKKRHAKQRREAMEREVAAAERDAAAAEAQRSAREMIARSGASEERLRLQLHDSEKRLRSEASARRRAEEKVSKLQQENLRIQAELGSITAVVEARCKEPPPVPVAPDPDVAAIANHHAMIARLVELEAQTEEDRSRLHIAHEQLGILERQLAHAHEIELDAKRWQESAKSAAAALEGMACMNAKVIMLEEQLHKLRETGAECGGCAEREKELRALRDKLENAKQTHSRGLGEERTRQESSKDAAKVRRMQEKLSRANALIGELQQSMESKEEELRQLRLSSSYEESQSLASDIQRSRVEAAALAAAQTARCRSLEEQLLNAKRQETRRGEELGAAQRQLAEARRQLVSQRDQIAALTLRWQVEGASESREEAERVGIEMAELRGTVAALREDIGRAEKNEMLLQEQLISLKSDCNSLNADRQRLQREVEKAREEVDKAVARAQENEENMSSWRAEYQVACRRVAELEAALERDGLDHLPHHDHDHDHDYHRDPGQHLVKVGGGEREKSWWESRQMVEMERHMRELQKELELERDRVLHAEKQVSEASAAVVKAELEMERAHADAHSARQAAQHAAHASSLHKEALQRAERRMEEIEEEKRKLKRELELMGVRAAEAENRAEESQKSAIQHQVDLRASHDSHLLSLEAQVGKLSEDLAQALANVSSAHSQLSSRDTEVTRARRRAADLSERLSALEEKLVNSHMAEREVEERLEKAQKEAAELRQRLSHSTAELKTWKVKAESFTEGGPEWAKLKEQERAVSENVVRLQLIVAEREADLQRAQQQLEAVEPSLAIAQQQMMSLTSRLEREEGEVSKLREALEKERQMRQREVDQAHTDAKAMRERVILAEEELLLAQNKVRGMEREVSDTQREKFMAEREAAAARRELHTRMEELLQVKALLAVGQEMKSDVGKHERRRPFQDRRRHEHFYDEHSQSSSGIHSDSDIDRHLVREVESAHGTSSLPLRMIESRGPKAQTSRGLAKELKMSPAGKGNNYARDRGMGTSWQGQSAGRSMNMDIKDGSLLRLQDAKSASLSQVQHDLAQVRNEAEKLWSQFQKVG